MSTDPFESFPPLYALDGRDASQGPGDTPAYIWQRTWELERLLDAYRALGPRRVLEIGSYTGGTLYHFLQASTPGTLVVSMDLYNNRAVDNRALYPEWTPDGVDLHVMQADSTDLDTVSDVWDMAPFDFVFIDGDHLEQSVRKDWKNYRMMVRPGGIVALHDILPAPGIDYIQVEPVWREIQRQGFKTREIIADPDAEWGGIGVVYIEEEVR